MRLSHIAVAVLGLAIGGGISLAYTQLEVLDDAPFRQDLANLFGPSVSVPASQAVAAPDPTTDSDDTWLNDDDALEAEWNPVCAAHSDACTIVEKVRVTDGQTWRTVNVVTELNSPNYVADDVHAVGAIITDTDGHITWATPVDRFAPTTTLRDVGTDATNNVFISVNVVGGSPETWALDPFSVNPDRYGTLNKSRFLVNDFTDPDPDTNLRALVTDRVPMWEEPSGKGRPVQVRRVDVFRWDTSDYRHAACWEVEFVGGGASIRKDIPAGEGMCDRPQSFGTVKQP